MNSGALDLVAHREPGRVVAFEVAHLQHALAGVGQGDQLVGLATVTVIGFSTSTCRPAARQSRAMR
jgi:hypothetical protein